VKQTGFSAITDSSSGWTQTRTYETSGSALGRDRGYALSGASGSGTETAADYGYDGYGRLYAVSSGGASFGYAYASNSHLIASIADLSSGWTQTRTYLADRDMLDVIETKVGATAKARFDYDYDTLSRRTSLAQSGEMFNRYVGGGEVTKWTYNDRSEVTAAQSYHGTNPADTSNPVGNRNLSFNFDNIGNRTSSSVDGRSTSYAANSLNQLTSRSPHGSIDVSGLAPASATITANGQATTRQGDYYFKSLGATNSSAAVWQSVGVTSTLGGSATRNAYVGRVGQSYAYDLDGNLTSDEHWDYTWDGENRLVAIQSTTLALAVGAPSQRFEFAYDYLGRRALKRVLAWQSGGWSLVSERKFIYDGWNLLAEYNLAGSTLTAAASYTWGLDVTGDLDDAGGVGALLQVALAGAGTHTVAYDANGNVTGLINRLTGALSAIYEYSAYGETLAAHGAVAAANAIRFSSKYTDAETGLIWYGFRYLDPSTGRWLGRDPIEEQGGLNLYAFCGNDGINHWDYLGMEEDEGTSGGLLDHEETWQEWWRLFVKAAGGSMKKIAAWISSGGQKRGYGSSTMGYPNNSAANSSGGVSRATGETQESGIVGGKRWTQAKFVDSKGNVTWVNTAEFSGGRKTVTLYGNTYTYASDQNNVATSGSGGATWSDALGGFVDWATGAAPEHQSFGPDTPQTRDMMNAPGVKRAREFFYNKNAGNGPGEQQSVENYRAGFGLKGLIQSGTNPTRQFVGNYRVDIYPNANGTLSFQLNNNTSVESFLYGIGPNWEQSTFQPGGNYRQTYYWAEPNKNVPQTGNPGGAGGTW